MPNQVLLVPAPRSPWRAALLLLPLALLLLGSCSGSGGGGGGGNLGQQKTDWDALVFDQDAWQ